MTDIEKAINYWKQFKKEIKKLREIKPEAEWDEQEKATDLAITALEKQIEKTPEANYIGEGDLSFECQVCEQTVNEGSFYCWYCGQNLLDEQWKNPIKAIGLSVEE